MVGSMSSTRRGVNARDTRARIFVCPGGSMKMIIDVGIGSGDMPSSTVPCAELYVSGSRLHCSTSA